MKVIKNKVRNNDINKNEWIDYFNNELTIESINNHLDISSNKATNLTLIKKKNYLSNNKNINNIKRIYISEEVISSKDFNIINKLKTKFNDNSLRNINKNRIIKFKINEIKKNNMKIYACPNRKISNNPKSCFKIKRHQDKNKRNYSCLSEYYGASYAKRHKYEKEHKIKNDYNKNKKKDDISNKNILFERTLPEMIVLNNFGLVNDEDYEFYKNYI